MTFLAPSFLWLSVAISIPIIIHIFSRLRFKTIEFSSVRFIQQLESNSIRKVKIQELLLLLLRMLIILCLVLMISQPFTKGFVPGWLSAEMDSKLILLIDNSASMSAKIGGKSFLERSKNEAMALLPLFNNKTQIVIAKTCPPEVVFKGKPNFTDFRKSIKSIQATNSYDDIWNVINQLITKDPINESINECIIFSDFMHNPDSSFIEGINNLQDWRFYFIQSDIVKNNIGITDASSLDRIKTLDKLIKLTTEVQNTGIQSTKNTALELLFNNQRVGQVITGFEAQKKKGFFFQAYPTEVGILQSKLILPSDDYDLDNIWYDTMPIMEKINCRIIGSDSNNINILEMVFNAIDPENLFLNIESVIQSNLKRLFFEEIDVAIIHNPKSISKEAIKDLEMFLIKGGGLIWFQGESKINQVYDDLLIQIGFPEKLDVINSGDGFFLSKIMNEKSDLLNDLQVRNVEKELPKVYRYKKLKLNSNHIVHWELNNKDPLIIEFSKGLGNVFYFSTLFDLRWSDLPIRAIALPLLQRLLVFTGTDVSNIAPVLVNETKWISIEESKLMDKWEVVLPSGAIEMVIPDYDKESIKITKTNELGIYHLYGNNQKFTSFPTRLNYKEYLGARINQKDIDFLLKDKQTKWLRIKDDFFEVFSEVRQGKSLWKLFLLLAFIFLLLESIIGKTNKENMKVENF